MGCAVPQRHIFTKCLTPMAEAALACGDLVAARHWADDTVAVAPGWHRMVALNARAAVAMAQSEPQQAERDCHDALAVAAGTQGYLHVPDTLEGLARLAFDGDNHQQAARLFGAAAAVRQRNGEALFPVFQADYDRVVAATRDALGQTDFDSAWTEGAALSTEEAITYAQRGRGERRRPTSGWESFNADRARRRATGQRRPRQPRCRHATVRVTAHRANASHPRLHQVGSHLSRAARPRSSAAYLRGSDVGRLGLEPRTNGL